jgi:hypothetical protein
MPRGMNGHWIRTRDPEGAKAFLDEQRMDRERREQAAARSRARRADAFAWLRSTWRRLLHR